MLMQNWLMASPCYTNNDLTKTDYFKNKGKRLFKKIKIACSSSINFRFIIILHIHTLCVSMNMLPTDYVLSNWHIV